MTTITSTVDYTAIKARQRDTWASGNYSVIGTTLQIVGESLNEAVDVQAGERVLDVAAGNGNASLASARTWRRRHRRRLRDVASRPGAGARRPARI